MGIRKEIGAWFSSGPFLGIESRTVEPQTATDKECVRIRTATEVLLRSHGKVVRDDHFGDNLSVLETVLIAGKPREVYIDAWGKDPGKADVVNVRIQDERSVILAKGYGESRTGKDQTRLTEEDNKLIQTCKNAVKAVGEKRFPLVLPPELADLT